MIHVGFSKGSRVDIPLLHTIVAAQTRYGKSTTIRTMMQYIPDDFKVVCLDVKDPRDFEGAGQEIPIYVENKTDPLMLKQLLEQESHLWLRKEFPELIDLCKEGDPFAKVLERVEKRMEEKVHPVVRDRLKVLRLLLKNLVENMAQVELSDTLELPAKKNVINLSKAPSAIKQLGVYSVVKWVLKKLRNVIIVIDELPDFAPQRYRTPSKNMIGQAIRKGGAKGVWLWLSGQTMTGVDKQVLKQAMIWILGHQREINEAKRTLDQIPFKTGLSVEDIMTLPVGHFVVCTDEGAYITYVQPEGVNNEVACQVSLGQISVNSISVALKIEKEDDDLVYKEKYEEEKRKREEVEKEFTRQVERLSDLKAEKKIAKAKEDWNKIAEGMAAVQEETKQEKEALEKELEPLRKLRDALGSILFPIEAETMKKMDAILKQPGFEPGADVPSKVSVSMEQPALILKKTSEPLELSQEDLIGRIAIVYAEGLLPPKKAFTLRQLLMIMEQRFGHKEAYPNLSKPLTELVAWGYLEKVKAGTRWDYRVKLSPKEAREKGLLKDAEVKR